MNTSSDRPLTAPSPRPRPVIEGGFENQSAKEAPSGRVTMYANQKATIGFMLKRHQPTAGIAMIPANRITDPKKPSFSEVAVRSPAAVPSANVASTAAQ